MEENPDLDLDPTMWISVPEAPTQFRPGLAADIAEAIQAFRRRESERALAAAHARRAAAKPQPG